MNESCYHCGDECYTEIHVEEKSFCCLGCKQVYLLLNENNLCNYYNLDKTPGIKVKGKFKSDRFAYLDDVSMIKELAQFISTTQTNITFELPQVHCSSCVYLLENLHRINAGIIVSRVNFQRKEIFISFSPSAISIREVVELLAFIGYEPDISLKDIGDENRIPGKKQNISQFNKTQIYRIGIAGFCFSNIMMLSFPEYFSSGHVEQNLKQLFSWLNLGLSLPVLFFSASGIFSSAWKGLRQKTINIDAPIALAIIVTFSRSYYEIFTGHGAGYLDSGCGIVFFMLIGRWFQNKTYDALSFDRDYLSYFPLGVTLIETTEHDGIIQRKEISVPVTKLKKDSHVIIRNAEMIPGDAVLISGNANIDYSFVNGENTPININKGEKVYAGGKQCGEAIELKIMHEVSQSYITELWNNDIFKTSKKTKESFIHPWSRYFTASLLSIALITVIFWWIKNPVNILPTLTSVLIIACPCSLLLSGTFTSGNMLRIFGRNKLYLKNAAVIESMASINTIVFDKTGTITEPNRSVLRYHGADLTDNEKNIIQHVSKQSSHPLSKLIASQLQHNGVKQNTIEGFREYVGNGVEAIVNNIPVRMGSLAFINGAGINDNTVGGSQVNVQVDENYKGYFSVSNFYKAGIRKCVNELKDAGYTLHVLSGDNDSEKENLQYIFGDSTVIKFKQQPLDKLEYISQLKKNNQRVMMVGDGLNDAGALMQADVGIAVNDNHSQFTPACDAILDGERIADLPRFLHYAKAEKKIVTASFILSIAYNIIGLGFAVSAHLSPLVAAILMPASSISIVLFVTIAGNAAAANEAL